MAMTAVAVHHDPIGQPPANTYGTVIPTRQITSGTFFRRSRQPACLAAMKDATSDKQDVAGIDSGYATAESASSSLEGGDLVKREGSIASNKVEIQKRKFFQRKVIHLREFDKTIPNVFHNRFADLCELLGKPLYDYLVKANLKYKGIGMKLKALGESEESAKPWIVVLCDSTILKKVKRFFQEPWVKAECQPHKADLPCFDIYFHDRAPKQHAGHSQLDVLQNPLSTKSNPETLCGRGIMVNHPNGFQAATLGGRIMVLNADGGLQAYALTAGHITSDTVPLKEDYDMEAFNDGDDLCERSVEDESESDSEIFELDLVHDGKIGIEDESRLHVQLPKITPQSDEQDQSSPKTWPKLGHIHATSCVADTANLDWALVTIDRLYNHLPNRIEDSSKLHSFWADITVPQKQDLGSGRSVVVMTGPEYPQRHGYLSDSTSFVLLAPGNQFVPVYDLKFSGEPALKPGDCGAWAIDSSTDEVYGHVVASDAFEEAYVVPLGATFKDIEKQLGAEAVYMPREREVPNLHWEQGIVENSASATYSPCSDSFQEALPTNATELTDFSMFEPFNRIGKDQSSTSTSPKPQEHDNLQQSQKWWEHPPKEFEAFKKSKVIPVPNDDRPLPDSGYASNQTSQTNSATSQTNSARTLEVFIPEKPLEMPFTDLFGHTDKLSTSNSFGATDHEPASQMFVPACCTQEPLENAPHETLAHPPLNYAERRKLYPKPENMRTRSYGVSHNSQALDAPSNTHRAWETFSSREKIKSWFRRYVARGRKTVQ